MPLWGMIAIFASLPLGALAGWALLAVRCSPLRGREG